MFSLDEQKFLAALAMTILDKENKGNINPDVFLSAVNRNLETIDDANSKFSYLKEPLEETR